MLNKTLVLAGLLAFLIGACCGQDIVVSTQYGDVGGAATAFGYEFRSIPYAKPPVGELRMRPPQSPDPWTGVRDVRPTASRCPQRTGGSEDCLYLSVYVPKNFSPDELPSSAREVLVYLHGGAFVGGSESNFIGRNLANRTNTVIVSANYRLGVFGLLGHTAFLRESGTYGNLLLLDQRKVLQWVRDNIANFGGNPNQVTFGGHSSGGISVSVHAVAPGSRGLFHRAIPLSGAGYSGELLNNPSWIQNTMWTVLERLNCSDQVPMCNRNSLVLLPACAQSIRTCFRSKSQAEVLAVQLSMPELVKPRPAVDGIVIPAQPLALVKLGLFQRVPTIHGHMANESTVLISRDYPLDSDQSDFDQYVRDVFSESAIQPLRELYPVPASYPNHFAAMAKIDTDWYYACPIQNWMRAMVQAGNRNVWFYYNTHVASWHPPVYGSFHGEDSIYAASQGTITTVTPPIPVQLTPETYPDEMPLVFFLQDIWTSLMKTNSPGVPDWPAYTAANGWPRLVIESPTSYRIDRGALQGDQCEFLDSIVF